MIKYKTISIIIFFLSSFIFGVKIVPLDEVEYPKSMIVDEGRVYLAEVEHIYIYSSTNFKLLKKFGKQGEGPKEFKIFPQGFGLKIAVHPDYLLVSSMAKVSIFTKDGEFKKEIKQIRPLACYLPLGNKFVGNSSRRTEKTRFQTINLMDENFEIVKELFKIEIKRERGGFSNPLKKTPMDIFKVNDNKIFIQKEEDFEILIFDIEGNLVHTIKQKYKRRKITGEDKKRIHQAHKIKYGQIYELNKHKYKFENYFPAIREIHARDKKVYAITWAAPDEKNNMEILIFDTNGKFLKKVFIPLAEESADVLYPISIYNDKLYQVVENPDSSQWEMHIHEIN